MTSPLQATKTNYDAKRFLSVEGISGSGKTTFCSILAQHLPEACVIEEPFDRWNDINGTGNLFEELVKNPARWAFTFQLYVFITNYQELEKAYIRQPSKELFITDRSYYSGIYTFSKVLYKRGQLTPMEWELYQQIIECLLKDLPYHSDGFIYLRTSPTTAYARTKKRNRDLDAGIDTEFIQQLYAYHEAWLIQKKDIPESLKKIPVLVLDGDVDFQDDPDVQHHLIQQVKEFIELIKQKKYPPTTL